MLRAIGATSSQIRSSILIEAALVGTLGSIAGIGAGIGVAALIEALFESQGGFPETTTVISLRTVVIAVAVGLLATMVSALVPAFKAGRISPVEAIRQEGTHQHRGRGRIAAGSVITIAGLAAVGYGLSGSSGVTGTLVLLGIGAVFTFVGVALLSGLFAGPAVMILGRSIPVGVLGTISGILLLIGGLALVLGGMSALVFASGAIGDITIPGQNGADDQVLTAPTGAGKVLTILLGSGFGILGVLFLFSGPRALADGARLIRDCFTGGSERKMVRIARENSARSPQRTAATATALMIGLALVTLVSVLGESLRASLSQVLSESVGADLFVNGEFGEVLPEDFAGRLSGLDGIDDVSEYRTADVRIGGPSGEIYGVDSFSASTESRIIDYGLDEGSFAGVADGTAVLVSRSLADERSYAVGDRITLEFEDLRSEDLQIAGIAGNENFLEGSFVIDNGLFIEHNPDRGIESIGATIADGVDFETVSDAAKALADDYAGVQVLNNEDLQEQLETGISALLVLINGLLGLALVVAFFGVVNTIVLSVLERTREIGLLRAVGMTRQQLMSTIRWEAIMVSLFGTLLGIGLGILFGIAGVRAIPDSVISDVSIPWLTLVVIVIMAGLIGVLAAYLPARRAAKLNPLDAIGSL
jgi:putative ABC transport system permease protein